VKFLGRSITLYILTSMLGCISRLALRLYRRCSRRESDRIRVMQTRSAVACCATKGLVQHPDQDALARPMIAFDEPGPPGISQDLVDQGEAGGQLLTDEGAMDVGAGVAMVTQS